MSNRLLHRALALALPAWLALAAGPAAAWWNAEWKQRTVVTLNTSPAGVPTAEAINGPAVPIRLHSGNVDFLQAKPDGSDLRVVAGDDKTPLKFWVERFDGANELAVVWVQPASVAPGSDKNTLYVYTGNAKAAPDAALSGNAVVDSGAALTLRFNEAPGQPPRDALGAGTAATAVGTEPNGLIGASARFDGSQRLTLPAPATLRASPGGAYTAAGWVRPTTPAGSLWSQGGFALGLEAAGSGAKAVLTLGGQRLEGGELPLGTWAQVAATVGSGKLTLYVNGSVAAQADLSGTPPAIEGEVALGAGFSGLLDEWQAAPVLRSADWIRFARAAQGADAKLVATQLQREGEATAGDAAHGGYMGILVKNLTVDAWVVIVLCGVLLVVAGWVMVVKAALVTRLDRGNHAFLKAFRDAVDPMSAPGSAVHGTSSLARLFDTGIAQLRKRQIGGPDSRPLTGASLDAVKASIDADLVRENHTLNSQMVWLTIAISGGPFLGLLGTVVGVMITFAAIAAAGDVNVNAIAPGIAAALLATVAGLAVAIPALFAYNWLTIRMKNITADMQIFVDEFVTRVAERYGER
jgi:biopolymer transport protein ExbB